MKIGFIGHKYVPSREGGVEIVVDRLSTIMASLGNDVTIFNRRRKEYKKIDTYNGCKVENIFTVDKKALDAIVYAFFATLKAKKAAKKGKFDVLHYHAEGPCFFLNLFPKKEKRKYKIVVTIHGLDHQRGKWGGFASKILLNAERKAAKYADKIIVLNKSNQEYFKNTYGRETKLIPNGIDKPELIKPEIIKKKYNLEFNSYILFLARIVPEKGLDYLLDAWNMMSKEEKMGKKLVIAGGDSHSTSYYQSICEKAKEEEDIILTGFVEGKELAELFSNSYLYVLPSDIEGMPISLLEAMSYGNTCLVSDIEENTSIINQESYSFNKSDVLDLKSKLTFLISKNIETHKEQYIFKTWEEVVDETLHIYKGL